MTPYTFTDAKADLDRFASESAPWKPTEFNADCELRLDYYLDRQVDDTVQELRRRFPETWQEVLPVTLPITRHFVNEKAKVFLRSQSLELFQKGEAVPSDKPLAAWWTAAARNMGLQLRLKNVDRYTELHRTAFLRISRVGAKLSAQVFFAQRVDAVFDPAFPMDLDMAHAVRLEVGSSAPGKVLNTEGQPAAPATKRWEFWCGRPGEDRYAVVTSDGTVESNDRNPFGSTVPVVMFTAHTEELGPFAKVGQGLHLFNRALNVAASDTQHIAEAQGFGQLVITAGPGEDPPSKIVRGPSRAIPLKGGTTATMLPPGAPISDLLANLDASIKRAAVLHGIPAGSVSLEARAAASGIALQIEMRPLLEARVDSIESYAEPMRRLWDVIRVVQGATKAAGEPTIGEDVELRWRPGEVQMPTDPQVELDQVVLEMGQNLCTRAEAIARLRRLPLEEAKKIAAQIAEENAADTGRRQPVQIQVPGQAPGGANGVPITAGARAALQTPAGQRREAVPAQE